MPSAFLPSCVSRAAISLAAEASPNSSTRTPGWAAWAAATAASGRATRVLACSSVPASLKSTTTERPSLEATGRSMPLTPSIRPSRATTSCTAAPRSVPVSTLHEHPLVGLLGEVRGLDDHVAALGLAAAAG